MSAIIQAQLAWRPDWGSSPDLQVLLDRQPEWREMRFKERGGMYLALDGDFANYIYWEGSGNTGGCGGETVTVMMQDGTQRKLLGPRSSRAECVNMAFPETPIIEAQCTADLAVLQRGRPYMQAAVTIEALKRIGAFPIAVERDARTNIRAEEAYLAQLDNGKYDFVINEGHGWETKDIWANRIKDWGVTSCAAIAEIFGGTK